MCVDECFGTSQVALWLNCLQKGVFKCIDRYKVHRPCSCQCRKICILVQMDFSSCENAMESAGMCQLLQLSVNRTN